MKHVISVGGGITSTLLLPFKVIEKYGKENVELVTASLINDEDDKQNLIPDLERSTGINVQRITVGGVIIPRGQPAPYGIWDIFFYTGIIGNNFADPCSRMLKRETIRDYMRKYHTPQSTVLHVGITYGEIDRMLAITGNWRRSGYRVEADLADDTTLNRAKVLEECKRLIGYVPDAYRKGLKHKNCNGFCVKSGKADIARLLYYDRKTYLYHETMELLHQQTFNHTYTVMRDEWTRNGKRGADSLTLRDFRLRMEAKWRGMLAGFDPFDGLEDTPACGFCDSAA